MIDVIEEDTVTSLNNELLARLPKDPPVRELIKNTEDEIAERKQFWRQYLKNNNITKIVAPMVDQSELAFRMLMKKYGAHLTFTPMIHAHLFVNDSTYRRNSLLLSKEDRPLVVQFCANNPDTFLEACRLVEGYCDGVDLNLGCPQMVAKRGHYGAYLQEEIDLVCEMVSKVRDYCKLPISCKIRILDCPLKTLDYAKRLVEAGATMLTVHGRTREMKGTVTGIADWSRIKQVVEAVDVPVVANGNVQMPGDLERCLEATKAVAVMSAEGILYNPLLFADRHEESWKIALDYLQHAILYQANISAVRAHVFRILHHSLLVFDDLRQRVSVENSIEAFQKVVLDLKERVELTLQETEQQEKMDDALAYFQLIKDGSEPIDIVKVSKSPHWLSKPYFRLSEEEKRDVEDGKNSKLERKEELVKRASDLGISIKQAKKRERRKVLGQKLLATRKLKFPPCAKCTQPGGQGCKINMCKKCCKYTCKQNRLDCPAHKSKFSHLPPVDQSCLSSNDVKIVADC